MLIDPKPNQTNLAEHTQLCTEQIIKHKRYQGHEGGSGSYNQSLLPGAPCFPYLRMWVFLPTTHSLLGSLPPITLAAHHGKLEARPWGPFIDILITLPMSILEQSWGISGKQVLGN